MASPAFALSSTFIPKITPSVKTNAVTPAPRTLQMVAPKHVRRSDEIKGLQRQLEDLKALQQKIATKNISNAPASHPQNLTLSSTDSVPSNQPINFRKHNESSRFLHFSRIEAEEYSPRILTVAGLVPGLTTEEFRTAPSMLLNKRPSKGNVFITKPPDTFTGELIALPGSDVLNSCRDPVVVLANPDEVAAIELPVAQGDVVALLVDRNISENDFSSKNFYLWDVNGLVHIGWLESLPHASQAVCLGKVFYGILELRNDLRRSRSCWEEENETYT